MKIHITIDGQSMTATLFDNSSAKALYETLQQGDMTFEAHDYGNFEKVGEIGRSLPQNNMQITTQPGDLILYQGNVKVTLSLAEAQTFTTSFDFIGCETKHTFQGKRTGSGTDPSTKVWKTGA